MLKYVIIIKGKVINMRNPIATIKMKSGKIIKVELYPEYAPETVNNFVYLAGKKFFDGMAFVRIVNGRLIQAGDPNMDGPIRHDVSPGYIINGEFNKENFENPLSFEKGVMGMAMAADVVVPYASAGSFFIMVKDEATLDAIVPAFGKIIEGMETVYEISESETNTDYGYDAPAEDELEYLESVTVETFGVDYPEPVKVSESVVESSGR